MMKRILLIAVVGMLSGCVSGKKPPDTYVGENGKTTIIESDSEMCKRSCNDDYSRCMDSSAAANNDGIHGLNGVLGASGECKGDLKKCLRGCNAP